MPVLAAAGGIHAATPALHLLDTVSLAETETHLQNPKVVKAENTKQPADTRHQPLAEVVPVVIHPAASARARRPDGRMRAYSERVTVSQSSPGPQVEAASRSAG